MSGRRAESGAEESLSLAIFVSIFVLIFVDEERDEDGVGDRRGGKKPRKTTNLLQMLDEIPIGPITGVEFSIEPARQEGGLLNEPDQDERRTDVA